MTKLRQRILYKTEKLFISQHSKEFKNTLRDLEAKHSLPTRRAIDPQNPTLVACAKLVGMTPRSILSAAAIHFRNQTRSRRRYAVLRTLKSRHPDSWNECTKEAYHE